MLTAGANYDQKQDVAKQRTQKRSAHHVILSEYCQLSQKFDSRADGRVESTGPAEANFSWGGI